MNKAESAVLELRAMDDLAAQDSPMHRLAPLSKLAVTVVYIFTVVSFSKYDLTGLLPMVLFPAVGYVLAGIPVSTCFQKLGIILPLVCAVGILNPFFDRGILVRLGPLSVSGGVVSMLSLMLKGVLCLMASFLLAATTPIEEICRALRQLHVPKMITSLLLLTFRYVSVLLEETSIMTEAYHLRAPGQKGIHVSAWGSFLGQLLLRSMDRAEALYESMLLRGFRGEFFYNGPRRNPTGSWVFAAAVIPLILLVRRYNIPDLLGSLFV